MTLTADKFTADYLHALSELEACPNRNAHIAAFPGNGRKICPVCKKIFVRDISQEIKGEAE